MMDYMNWDEKMMGYELTDKEIQQLHNAVMSAPTPSISPPFKERRWHFEKCVAKATRGKLMEWGVGYCNGHEDVVLAADTEDSPPKRYDCPHCMDALLKAHEGVFQHPDLCK